MLCNTMIPTMMVLSTMVITSNLIILKSLLNIVIKMDPKLLMLVKSTLVLLTVKTLGEMKTVQITVMFIVIVHSTLLNVLDIGLVMMSNFTLKKFSLTMILTWTELSTQKMKSLKNITNILLLNVISISMDLLKFVKSTNVSSMLKMNGELKTVQIMVNYIVIVSHTEPAKVNGTVLMSLKSLMKS
jgi:hypothetical protein